MGCGPWCVYYRDRDKHVSICKGCSYHEDKRSRFEVGLVDPFELARGLKEKAEKERRRQIPQLSDCPKCKRHSLFYNCVDGRYECLNLDCKQMFTEEDFRNEEGL